MKVTDIKPKIGAKIEASKEDLLSGKHAKVIRDVLQHRGVVVFPKVGFTDKEQMDFTKTLGIVVEEGEGNIQKITLDKEIGGTTAEYLKGAFFWHLDGTTLKVPIFASLLSAHVLSAEGGDTEICNTYAAYEDLPEEEKQQIDKLKAVHSVESSQLYVKPEVSYEELLGWRQIPSNTLPLVWTHKDGRKSLILGNTAGYVVDKTVEESRAILSKLRSWATQPEYVYRHKWSVGDLIIWDNTGTLHRALPYAMDSGRMMHRTKLEGEEAFA